MGNMKGPTEGGSGGRRGHSNMEHWVTTEEIKSSMRRRRRQQDIAAVREQLSDQEEDDDAQERDCGTKNGGTQASKASVADGNEDHRE